MKKLLLFIFPLLFVSCTCTLAQIPPQVIYAGAECTAPIPDYRTQVIISDNCEIESVTQIPAPGYLLTSDNQIINVTIRAMDVFKNVTEAVFTVTLLDTIPPVIEWPSGQVSMTDEDLNNLYASWVAAVKVHGIAKWMYDRTWTQGLPLADTTYVDSCGVVHDQHVEDNLRYFTNIIKLTDQEYFDYVSFIENH